jgi:hypothetical protein
MGLLRVFSYRDTGVRRCALIVTHTTILPFR